MKAITEVLYWISTGLLVPVIVLLILLFLRSLLLLGTFFGQYLNMRRTESALAKLFKNLKRDGVDEMAANLPTKNCTPVVDTIRQVVEASHGEFSEAQIDRVVGEFELQSAKDMSVSKTLTKMGPMLGLMGTLIPMGPALVGLAAGDIASMAYNMQVAFATTVIGLFAGAIGWLTQSAKQRWYMSDVNRLDFLSELLK